MTSSLYRGTRPGLSQFKKIEHFLGIHQETDFSHVPVSKSVLCFALAKSTRLCIQPLMLGGEDPPFGL